MKTKWMIIPVVAIALGCAREIDTNVKYIDGEFTLYATSGENETRTVLQQDGRVFWSPSDCITVFYGNIPGKFTSTNTEPAASAEFTGSLGSFTLDGETEFRAIYPHSDDIVMPNDNGILSIGLPSEQTAVEGTFADDLFICVAKSKDVNLHFYNVCGGVKFSLARDDIKKVVFRGNNGESLAGRMAVEFDSDGIPQVTDMTGGRSSVTLVAPDGGTFKQGAFYYLVLVPQVLQKGYTMELYADELVETISSDSSVSIRRSVWGVLKDLGSQSSVSVPEAIDLGLPSGLKWASFNLGALKPEEYGDYYAWGETEPYYSSQDPLIWKEGKEVGYDWASYKWCTGGRNSLTKYCLYSWNGDNGYKDGKIVLEPEDDAAHMNLGGKWRTPSKKEQEELRDNCTWEWTQMNGVNGYRITGHNGSSIFLPAAGYWGRKSQIRTGSDGQYWSSSLNTDDSGSAFFLGFDSDHWYLSTVGRSYGASIRPVYDDSDPEIEMIIPEAVDLGLSVKWASFNLGASQPEDSGDYFAWGETEPKWDYSWETYKWCMGSKNTQTKYCTDSSYGYNGFMDNKTVLDPEDDAAQVNLGGKWRMPTREEQYELRQKCTWQWTQRNGVYGLEVTGLNGKSIFFPAAGYWSGVYHVAEAGHYGSYWSSSLYTSSDLASGLFFSSGDVGWNSSQSRSYGRTIRPVYDDPEPIIPEAVDLGLSVKWASFNLGASEPEDYGDYFAWGETEQKLEYSWKTYKWCMGSYNNLTKYCTVSAYGDYGYNGFTDGKIGLDLEDDAARVILGGTWRMPTKGEQDELRNRCSWEWTQVNGINGYIVIGPNGSSIFLPAAGSGVDKYLSDVGSYGLYWSSSLDTDRPGCAYSLIFNSDNVYMDDPVREHGLSIRPVTE